MIFSPDGTDPRTIPAGQARGKKLKTAVRQRSFPEEFLETGASGNSRGAAIFAVFAAFAAVFFLVPFSHLKSFAMMPGDIGDARLNNYFLENIYLFLTGKSASLWHPGFFSPFPFVLGFGDNLFGSAPVYVTARLAGAPPDSAFQAWFLIGYPCNFFAAYHALRRLDVSRLGSVAGGLIFTFSLPVTAQWSHAQLHYRFAAPLSIAAFLTFLEKKTWRPLAASGAWLVWQFYCGIYIGFFTLLVLAAVSVAYLFLRNGKDSLRDGMRRWMSGWKTLEPGTKLIALSCFLSLIVLLALLFYPYLMVSRLYDAHRPIKEIASMLPRWKSYFLADGSFLWSAISSLFEGVPMRHEHQMFIGMVPILLAIAGACSGGRSRNGIAFPLLAGSLAGLMAVTSTWAI